MLACKLAATGFSGVELREVNLSLNEVGETPLDSFTRPSGISVLYGLFGSYGRPEVAARCGSQSTIRRKRAVGGGTQKRDQPLT